MFIDASAICAILLGEPDADELGLRIDGSRVRLTSCLAVYESVLAIARSKDGDILAARNDVATFLAEADVAVVGLGEAEQNMALDAFQRFGKGRHPAKLNMGDCFAYACARTHGVPLLFKGDDFALTDVAIA